MSAVTTQLDEDGVPFRLGDDDTIFVPQEKVFSERVALAGQGLFAGS